MGINPLTGRRWPDTAVQCCIHAHAACHERKLQERQHIDTVPTGWAIKKMPVRPSVALVVRRVNKSQNHKPAPWRLRAAACRLPTQSKCLLALTTVHLLRGPLHIIPIASVQALAVTALRPAAASLLPLCAAPARRATAAATRHPTCTGRQRRRALHRLKNTAICSRAAHR